MGSECFVLFEFNQFLSKSHDPEFVRKPRWLNITFIISEYLHTILILCQVDLAKTIKHWDSFLNHCRASNSSAERQTFKDRTQPMTFDTCTYRCHICGLWNSSRIGWHKSGQEGFGGEGLDLGCWACLFSWKFSDPLICFASGLSWKIHLFLSWRPFFGPGL